MRLVPQLVAKGHEVVGTSRSFESARSLRAYGAEPVALDVLDRAPVLEAVAAAKPDAIVHQATALTGLSDFKHFDRSFAQTNQLRTEGTDALIAAAREVGVERFVAQSFASNRYVREGGPVKSEDDPLDPNLPEAMRESQAAMIHLEQTRRRRPSRPRRLRRRRSPPGGDRQARSRRPGGRDRLRGRRRPPESWPRLNACARAGSRRARRRDHDAPGYGLRRQPAGGLAPPPPRTLARAELARSGAGVRPRAR
jgi:2-alkyl-3-oxoalkanoate reductase